MPETVLATPVVVPGGTPNGGASGSDGQNGSGPTSGSGTGGDGNNGGNGNSGGDPHATTDWRTSIPEEFRSSPSLTKFKSPGDLAKSYLELEKMPSLRLPKDGADEKEWEPIYTKLGRPESPDKYEFKRPTLPEGSTYDEALEGDAKKMFFEAGLNTKQAQSLLDKYTASTIARNTAAQTALAEQVGALKKEWGGDWDNNVKTAAAITTEFGGDDLKKLFNDTLVGDHPVMIKAWTAAAKEITRLRAQVTELTKEDTTHIGDNRMAENAQVIEDKIAAIYGNPNHPYNSKTATTKAHDAAVKEMLSLNEQLEVARGDKE